VEILSEVLANKETKCQDLSQKKLKKQSKQKAKSKKEVKFKQKVEKNNVKSKIPQRFWQVFSG
jgi:hypothetical protein